jgi:hypothetical protein
MGIFKIKNSLNRVRELKDLDISFYNFKLVELINKFQECALLGQCYLKNEYIRLDNGRYPEQILQVGFNNNLVAYKMIIDYESHAKYVCRCTKRL